MDADWLRTQLERAGSSHRCRPGDDLDQHRSPSALEPRGFREVDEDGRLDQRRPRLSDFLNQCELHRQPSYELAYDGKIDYHLDLALPSPPWLLPTFMFLRFDGDFSERDRLILATLQPHLIRLRRQADVCRRLAAARAALERGREDERRGIVLLDGRGRLELVSRAARRLLGEFFAGGEAGLPPEVADWLDAGLPSLVRTRQGRRLTLERSGDAVILEEDTGTLGLSAREREVLDLVARDKTNVQIAQLLWVTPNTVRKHLENAYAKLVVHTRTAAAARLLGAPVG
jgi:DNA-binding CsgD family transcriptional regulator